MQNWSCMHPCGHSSIKFLWSCDTRAQDLFFLFKSTQCFQNMFFYQFVHSSESILGVRENFHSIHPSGVYTHFFKNWLRSVNFSKKSCKLSLSKACWCFSQTTFYYYYYYYFLFLFLLALFFHEVFCYLNIRIFGEVFCYIHACPRYLATQTYIYMFCEIFLLYTCISKVSCYLNIHIYVL